MMNKNVANLIQHIIKFWDKAFILTFVHKSSMFIINEQLKFMNKR